MFGNGPYQIMYIPSFNSLLTVTLQGKPKSTIYMVANPSI